MFLNPSCCPSPVKSSRYFTGQLCSFVPWLFKQMKTLASIGKLRAAGFAPGGNFNQGIQETIEFLKQPQP